jgi:hypothetical protein
MSSDVFLPERTNRNDGLSAAQSTTYLGIRWLFLYSVNMPC